MIFFGVSHELTGKFTIYNVRFTMGRALCVMGYALWVMRFQCGSVLQTLVLSMLQDEASTLKRQDVASTTAQPSTGRSSFNSAALNLLNP